MSSPTRASGTWNAAASSASMPITTNSEHPSANPISTSSATHANARPRETGAGAAGAVPEPPDTKNPPIES